MTEPDLRDALAVVRTRLANERTFLSYARTALALGGAGLVLLKFFSGPYSTAAACLLIVAGAITMGFGTLRFRAVQKTLKIARNSSCPKSSP